MPTVSVVTTIYNCESFITDSIKSVLDQSYKDFEFIIINDGSTDGTWNKVQDFSDDRLIKVNHKENKKIPYRRNEAIEMAKGKYIAIHDGDDISLRDRLKIKVTLIEQNNNLFCLGGHAVKIDEQGNEIGFMTYPPKKHDIVVSMMRRGFNAMIDPSTLFRRDDFLELGKYSLDQDIYTVPDLDLWTRAILVDKLFSNVTSPVIRYRINPNGVNRKHNQEMKVAHNKVTVNFFKSWVQKNRDKLMDPKSRYV